jgi:Tfp pilus assembly protein PilF
MKENLQLEKLLLDAQAKLSVRKYGEAEDILKKGEALDESNPQIFYKLCIVYFKQSNYSRAIEYLNRIIELPYTTVDIIEVRTLLCIAYMETEEYNKAGQLLVELVKLMPQNIQILSMLAFYHEKTGKPDKALEIHRKILKIDKDNTLAFLLAQKGDDLNSALKSARIAISKDEDNPAYCDTLGYVHLKRAEMDLAKVYLKKALLKAPHDKTIKEHLNELLGI